jgi:hypothetical protein
MGVLTLLLLGVGVLVVAWFREPQERLRTLRLGLVLGATGSLVLIVGRARAGLGQEYALSGVYLNMALPALCCVYFIWTIYGKPSIGSVVQMCMFIGMCLLFLPNLTGGLDLGWYSRRSGREVEKDIRAGVPPFVLAERHIQSLKPSHG